MRILGGTSGEEPSAGAACRGPVPRLKTVDLVLQNHTFSGLFWDLGDLGLRMAGSMRIFAPAIWRHLWTLRFQAVCGFLPLVSGCTFGPLDFKQYADFCPWHLDALFDL